MDVRSLVKISALTGMLLLSAQSFSQTNHTKANHKMTPATSEDRGIANTPAEDAMVVNTVNKLFHNSKMLSGQTIQVSSNNGVVTLAGNVDSTTQASVAAELAQSVGGVSKVDTSLLTVKEGQQYFEDAMITAKIKGLLVREDLFGKKDVASVNTSVETKDGVVYLSGFIDNKQQIDNAIAIIKQSVPEVKKVEYHLKEVAPKNTGK